MGSTRLPGKVLKDLAGRPMLERVVRRVHRAGTIDEVVVATSDSAKDDAIARLCTDRGWSLFRGSEQDVLDRYRQAARAHDAETVARVTGDCPLIDPAVCDQVVEVFQKGTWDYVANTLEPRTFPRGLDVEVFTRESLEVAWKEDTNPHWREHVTPFLYRHPDRFRLHGVYAEEDRSHMRWTVDTEADLEFVRRIYDHFSDDAFGWREVLSLLEEHPEWMEINRHVKQKRVG